MKTMGYKKTKKQPEELPEVVYDVQAAQTFIDKAKELYKAVEDAKQHVKELEAQLEEAQDKVDKAENPVAYQMSKLRRLLPQEFYSRDIDHNWQYPKKYTMRSVKYENGKIYVKVRWDYKKEPWKGFNPEHIFTLEEFLNLRIGTSPNKANEVWQQRPCPKCGQPMGGSNFEWCCECVKHRQNKIVLLEEKYPLLYSEETGSIYRIQYMDELTRAPGYYGNEFIVKRLDTGELIKSNNVFSAHSSWAKNLDECPRIEFIKYDGMFESKEYTEEQFENVMYAHEIIDDIYNAKQEFIKLGYTEEEAMACANKIHVYI